MKYFSANFLLLTVLLFTAVACTKENNEPAENELQGEWYLVDISCFCEPIDLEKGESIWEFDIENSEVHIDKNTNKEGPYLFNTGSYPITVTDSTVSLSNRTYDYYFENSKLYLSDNPAVDGPLLEFERD